MSGTNEAGSAIPNVQGDSVFNPSAAFPEFNDIDMDLDMQNTDWMWDMGFTSLLPVDIDSFSAPFPPI